MDLLDDYMGSETELAKEAKDRGMTIEQLKLFKKMEKENELYRREQEKEERKQRIIKAVVSTVIGIVYTIIVSVVSILLYSNVNESKNISNEQPTQTSTTINIEEATYYWVTNGKVYHLYEDCPSLSNSVNIQSGTLDKAQRIKDRLCKTCESNLLVEIIKQAESEPDT